MQRTYHLFSYSIWRVESLWIFKNLVCDVKLAYNTKQVMKRGQPMDNESNRLTLKPYGELQNKTNNSPLRFSGKATNFRHTDFSWKQWCCSARANVVATVFIATSSQRLASHINLSLSIPYRSAAARRCWAIKVEAPFEFKPVSSSISGSASQYIKWSRACKAHKAISNCWTQCFWPTNTSIKR